MREPLLELPLVYKLPSDQSAVALRNRRLQAIAANHAQVVRLITIQQQRVVTVDIIALDPCTDHHGHIRVGYILQVEQAHAHRLGILYLAQHVQIMLGGVVPLQPHILAGVGELGYLLWVRYWVLMLFRDRLMPGGRITFWTRLKSS